ncbi:MAG TPA: phage tail sheath C-terminal domain-containing protein [Chitinophagaceae bacterium]
MANYRSPGVYVEEISMLPPTIAEVESAVPAFIGYTEKAKLRTDDDLLNVPTAISSWSDFVQYYGGPEGENAGNIAISVNELKTGAATTGFNITVALTAANLSKHIFYHAIKHFYANGGSRCYIVSVGKYADAIAKDKLVDGLNLIGKEDPPTILVIPEAVFLSKGDFKEVNQALLKQASDMKDRFAILDTRLITIPKTSSSVVNDAKDTTEDLLEDKEIRRYGAVYYPFLETTYKYAFKFDDLTLAAHTVNGGAPGAAGVTDMTGKALSEIKNAAALMYNAIDAEYSKNHIVLPPSTAMAGVYTRVDNARGFWKAPANVGVADVIKATVSVARSEHDLINIPDNGRSVNAILNVPGSGTVVMGGRTVDGLDGEWKYISVRRFFNVVEESIKKSTSWVVFEPNTAPTWTKVQSMIENYLFEKWRDGALAGAKPEQAFYVKVGLGKTMTAQDINDGRLIVEIGMAVARPAEFIILRFIQTLQQS